MPYKSKADALARRRELRLARKDNPGSTRRNTSAIDQIMADPEAQRYRLDAIAALRAKEKTWGATSPWKKERKCA